MEARIDQVVTTGEITVDGATHEMTNNTWVIGDDDEVIVIDPGHDAAAVLDVVGEREVLAIICTHGHSDHVRAAVEVAERDEAPVALHPKDLSLWRETHADDDPEIEVADGGIFEVSDVRLEVIVSPGHTPGSVCLYCDELGVVFSGDTLLASGPGRYCGEFPNFPGQLTAVGEYLLTLPPSTRVLPGHGEETTVRAAEKRFDGWVTAGPDAPEEIPDPADETVVDAIVDDEAVDEEALAEAEAALAESAHAAEDDEADDDDEDVEDDADADVAGDFSDDAEDDDDEDAEPEPVTAGRGRRFLRRRK